MRVACRASTSREAMDVRALNELVARESAFVDRLTTEVGKTIVGVSTTEKALADSKFRPNVASAEQVGKLVAERALAANITSVVFDRGGFTYHGKVKALADAARTGGLIF